MNSIDFLKDVLFNTKQQWVLKIYILVSLLWLSISIIWKLSLLESCLLLLGFSPFVIMLNLVVAALIPKMGFWYYHGFEKE